MVDGEFQPGKIATNRQIKFYINWNNNYSGTMEGTTNGFRVYSPDGAQWNNTTAENVYPGWDLLWGQFGTNLIIGYSDNGYGADTIGFLNLADPGAGLPSGFDDTVSTITIGPISDWDEGRTICIDSSFFGGTGYWSWARPWSGNYYPAWDGPHCFTIESNTLTFSGNLYYQDPVPPDTLPVLIKRMRIEAWDDDLWPAPDQLLASDETNDYGHYD
ncbi:MAG: hypothetical protein P1R58_01745 [bacterium]|nr:hypothetical protein [bacterium]